MKVILNLCVICLIVALVGCETTEDTTSSVVSPSASLGAVDDAQNSSGVCPFAGSNADASLGAVNDAPTSCCGSCGKSKASLVAVSDTPSSCSGSGVCPYAGKKSDG